MWDPFLEWCADLFGVTVRSRFGHLLLATGGLFLLGIVLVLRWGPEGWLGPAAFLGFAAYAARLVSAARDAVWRAVCLPLDTEKQAPGLNAGAPPLPSTAASLYRLAAAVDDVRRGAYAAASARLPRIERRRLRPEEAQLLDAVQARIALGLDSDLDAWLGRALVTEAWNQPERLRALDVAWRRAGTRLHREGALGRLQTLTRLRIAAAPLDRIPAAEARGLAEEARAIGDEALAAELDARSREGAYR